MDLFNLFNMDFGFAPEESAKEEEVKVEEVTTEVTDTTDTTDEKIELVMPGFGDDEDDDDSLDMSTDEEESAKDSKASKTSSTKSKKGYKGKDEVALPVTVKGDFFTLNIDGFGSSTFDDVVRQIISAGYNIVKCEDTKLVYSKEDGILYVCSPRNHTGSNNLVTILDGTSYTVECGMEQMTVTADDFSGKEKDELCVLDLTEKFGTQFPSYADCSMYIDNAVQVAIPVFDSLTGDVELPKTVIVCGNEITVSDIKGKTTVKNKDLNEHIAKILGFDKKGYPVNGSVKTINDKLIYSLSSFSSTEEVKVARILVNANADNKKTAAKYYRLPVTVAIPLFNRNVELREEHFAGKEKVTAEELLNLLKGQFATLASKDRKIDLIYEESINIVSVVINSGTKGAYELPETESYGLYKLVRTIAEFKEAIKEKYFLGNFISDEGENERFEVNPTGIFVGELDRYSQIKRVTFIKKLPLIPRAIFDEIVSDFSSHPDIERIVRIYWDESESMFRLMYPNKDTKAYKGLIKYSFDSVPYNWSLYLTVHSHNTMNAYFSSTDNADEDYTGLFGVIGNVDTKVSSKFRAGMDGVFCELSYDTLFER